MTPKEKASELMQKAYDLDQYNKTSQSRCKQIALFCVAEILKARKVGNTGVILDKEYWQEVKQETEKI